ncbi:uncharacterized protein [Nicotiana sylvestris]|uniref:uncharacterized protein n=1 Tax=Nicotiana sylvestris TaxID=4096 RepID=UPI00388C951F
MVDFDVILGEDWLSPYHAVLDYYAKTVTLAMLGLPRIEWRGSLNYVPSRVISYLKAQRMVRKGCLSYLAFVRDVGANTPTIDSVPVVRVFPDVFPANLPSMPPDRDIDFGIDLVAGTKPISIPLYRMAPPELKKLNERLHELLDKVYGFFDVQDLANQFVRLYISEPSLVVACMVSRSSLFDSIGELQYDDPHLFVLKDKVQHGEARLLGTDLVQDALDKIKFIQERLRMEQSRQKSYAVRKVRDVACIVGEKVLLKFSPMQGVMRFGKKEKLRPRYIRPFEVLQRVGEVAYKLVLPPIYSTMYPIFHVSMLRKYVGDLSHVLDFSTVQLDSDLTYDVEPVDILDRQVRKLRSKNIALVKVQWKGQLVKEATWKTEREMRSIYPHLF